MVVLANVSSLYDEVSLLNFEYAKCDCLLTNIIISIKHYGHRVNF
jgi:hypothetical protein